MQFFHPDLPRQSRRGLEGLVLRAVGLGLEDSAGKDNAFDLYQRSIQRNIFALTVANSGFLKEK